MKDWHPIKTQEDVEYLMSAYGDFHDSCIVSLNFQSGAYVYDDQSMYFGDAQARVLSVVFQHQWEPKTAELQFIGLRQLHLVGWQDNYLCEISEAYLSFHHGLLPGQPEQVIVWSDNDSFDPVQIDGTIHEPADTYIIANELRWRTVDDR